MEIEQALENFGLDVHFTEEQLRHVFRRAVLLYHPDRGGTQEMFDFFKKQYDILNSFLQARKTEFKGFQDFKNDSLAYTKEEEKKGLGQQNDPKKFDPVKFNQVFNDNRLLDVHDTGYGQWYQYQDMVSPSLSSSKKNVTRSNFNQTFEEERRRGPKSSSDMIVIVPDSAYNCLTSCGYTFLGEERISDFSGGSSSGLAYVDLKKAHSETFLVHPDTVPIRKQYRNVDEYEAERRNIAAVSPEELLFTKQQEEEEVKKELNRQMALFRQDRVQEKHHAKVTQHLLN